MLHWINQVQKPQSCSGGDQHCSLIYVYLNTVNTNFLKLIRFTKITVNSLLGYAG